MGYYLLGFMRLHNFLGHLPANKDERTIQKRDKGTKIGKIGAKKPQLHWT